MYLYRGEGDENKVRLGKKRSFEGGGVGYCGFW